MSKVPVFLINRNRFTTTKTLSEWLLTIPEVSHVCILDNDSTYPPLLEWYANLPDRVTVNLLKSNPVEAHQIFWKLGMDKVVSKPYIVSDSDMVPAACCPKDLIARMITYSERYRCQGYLKIGPSIRIDNLPDSPWKQAQIDSNLPNWEKRHGDTGAYISAIDTTFAIYREGYGDAAYGHALRLAWPYYFEHVPWYKWPMDDEEIYYLQHASESSTFLWHVKHSCPEVLEKQIEVS